MRGGQAVFGQQHGDAIVDAVHRLAVAGDQRLAQGIRLRAAIATLECARGNCTVQAVQPGAVQQCQRLAGGRADKNIEQLAIHRAGNKERGPLEYFFSDWGL